MAFENCSNCGSIITCSCEYKVAKDGSAACDNCVGAYNMGLMTKKVVEEVKIEEVIVKEEVESNKKQKNNSL